MRKDGSYGWSVMGWRMAETRTASVVRCRASRVAGSAELSVGTPAQLRLQRAGPGAQHRHQRAERRLARAPGSSAAGVADEWSARDDGGAGRSQPAARVSRLPRSAMRHGLLPERSGRNPGEHRLGHQRRHWVDRGRIVCPWHGSWFAAGSGEVLRGPSAAPLPCYQARLVDGMVEVRAEEVAK
jgi:Rieske [2Fe-2S] domain